MATITEIIGTPEVSFANRGQHRLGAQSHIVRGITTRAGQLPRVGLGRIELQQFGQGIRPGLVRPLQLAASEVVPTMA